MTLGCPKIVKGWFLKSYTRAYSVSAFWATVCAPPPTIHGLDEDEVYNIGPNHFILFGVWFMMV
jgi:hypothetical protein